RPNGRCSLSGSVWPSPDSGLRICRLQTQRAATASEASRHHTFSAPGTGFFAAETEVRIRPSALPEAQISERRIGKARRWWAFSPRLHMSAENVNAWWARQGSNL